MVCMNMCDDLRIVPKPNLRFLFCCFSSLYFILLSGCVVYCNLLIEVKKEAPRCIWLMPVISVNVKLRTKLPLSYKYKKIVHNHVPGYKKFKSRVKNEIVFFPKDFCNNRSMDKNFCFIDR